MPGWGMTGSQVHDEGLMAYATSPVTAEQRRRAVRMVAHLSKDAEDCVLMLSMLGLDVTEGTLEESAQ